MTRRVQINENIDIRESSPGSFAVFSTDKSEFLKVDGKEITLDKDNPLTLVIPEKHALEKLDLTLKDKDGKPLPLESTPLLIVENQGKNVELAGNNLAVMGNATMAVTQHDLTGIDAAQLKNKTIDVIDPFPEDAAKNGATKNDLARNTISFEGNELDFGGKRIVALSDAFGGRIDFIDKNGNPKEPTTLLTLNSANDHGVARGRIMDLQNRAMQSLAEALNNTQDAEIRKKKLSAFGLPEDDVNALPDGNYEPKPWQNSPGNRLFPAVDAKEEWRKPYPLPDLEIEIPNGREKVAVQDKAAQISPPKEAFYKGMSHGLDPQVAYALARMNANRDPHADHNSIEVPASIPGGGGVRQR